MVHSANEKFIKLGGNQNKNKELFIHENAVYVSSSVGSRVDQD